VTPPPSLGFASHFSILGDPGLAMLLDISSLFEKENLTKQERNSRLIQQTNAPFTPTKHVSLNQVKQNEIQQQKAEWLV